MRKKPSKAKKMTLKEATRLLEEAGIENARGEARTLFRHYGGFADYELLSPTLECDSDELRRALVRRKSREPIQYIIGEVDFYRERYKVTPDCLIPRQDTEILVDYAVKNLGHGARILDLCTGSGCVGLSIINNLEGAVCTLVDISESALSVARENAERLGLSGRVTFLLFDAASTRAEGAFDAVVSKGDVGKIGRKITLQESIAAPVKAGDEVGRVQYLLGNEVLGEVPITAREDIGKIGFFGLWQRLLAKILLI